MEKQVIKEELDAYADRLRDMIYHENLLTDQRTNWLLVTQGALIAAIAALTDEASYIGIAICIFGILATASFGHAIQNSFESRQYFKAHWKRKLDENGFGVADFAPLDGAFPGNNARRWLLPWLFIPRLLICAWFLIAIFLCSR